MMATGSTQLSRGQRPARVRWDRVSRIAMLCALVVLLYLAVSPIRSLIADVHLAGERRAQLQHLRQQAATLAATESALRRRSTSDAEARNLGFVRRGEHPYIVSGLPDN